MLRNRTVEVAVEAAQDLDLDSVKTRIMDPHLGEGWTREYADSIEYAYRNYLTMLIKYPEDAEDILLSKDVDRFWHTHILDTRKYHRDCQDVFGGYLHHMPHIGEVMAADEARRSAQAEKTRRLYEREFGTSEEVTAFCGATSREAAFCGATNKEAAFCGATSKEAAFCGATNKEAAFCGATSKEAAFCGAMNKEAAFCGATNKEAAFCGAASKEAAFCGATSREAVKANVAAFCGAARRT